jgi:hypothetical protein
MMSFNKAVFPHALVKTLSRVIFVVFIVFAGVAFFCSKDVVYLNMKTADLQCNVELFGVVLLSSTEPFDGKVAPARYARGLEEWKRIENRPLLAKLVGASFGPSSYFIYNLRRWRETNLDDTVKMQIRDTFLQKTASEGMVAGARYLRGATLDELERQILEEP